MCFAITAHAITGEWPNTFLSSLWFKQVFNILGNPHIWLPVQVGLAMWKLVVFLICFDCWLEQKCKRSERRGRHSPVSPGRHSERCAWLSQMKNESRGTGVSHVTSHPAKTSLKRYWKDDPDRRLNNADIWFKRKRWKVVFLGCWKNICLHISLNS